MIASPDQILCEETPNEEVPNEGALCEEALTEEVLTEETLTEEVPIGSSPMAIRMRDAEPHLWVPTGAHWIDAVGDHRIAIDRRLA